jgi:hypothetical protein
MSISLTLRLQKRWVKSADWLKGFLRTSVTLNTHKIFRKPIRDVSVFQRRIPFIERKEYSQNGEDGIINAIFKMIGTTNKYYVEFGVEDGIESNSRYLWKHKGWKGLMMDGGHENDEINLQKEFITAENIEELFTKHNVPKELDLLSIDIDGNDYWLWKAISNYHPRVVIMEYNAHVPPTISKTIPYQADFCWDGTDYFGASLLALATLGKQKGYTLIGTDRNGVNAFFVLTELVAGNFTPLSIEALFHPPAFKGKKGNSHPEDTQNRPWVDISVSEG